MIFESLNVKPSYIRTLESYFTSLSLGDLIYNLENGLTTRREVKCLHTTGAKALSTASGRKQMLSQFQSSGSYSKAYSILC